MKAQKETPRLEIIRQAFERHRQELTAYAARRCGSVADAEDVVQDVFVQLMERCEVLVEQTIRPLLYHVASNLLIDRLRRRQKRWEIQSYLYDLTPQSSRTTEHDVLAHEIRRVEQNVVALMPEQRRRSYELTTVRGLSPKEIGQELHIDPRTVSTHVCLARRDVRQALRAVGYY